MDIALGCLSRSTTLGAIRLATLALDAARGDAKAFTAILEFIGRYVRTDRLAIIVPDESASQWVTYASIGEEVPEPGTPAPGLKGRVLDFLRDGAMMHIDPTKGVGWDFYVSVTDDRDRFVGVLLVDDTTSARQFSRDENRDLSEAAALLGRILGHKVPALEMRQIDAFTGLATPRAFETRLPELVLSASRKNEPVWFVSADPDRLRWINEEAGTEAGDNVVLWMADALKRSVSREDIAVRWNGAWLMAAGTGTRGLDVGLNMHEIVSRGLHINPELGDLRVSVSIGASEYDPNDKFDSITLALERAEDAMNRAKQRGGSHVLFGRALESAMANK